MLSSIFAIQYASACEKIGKIKILSILSPLCVLRTSHNCRDETFLSVNFQPFECFGVLMR